MKKEAPEGHMGPAPLSHAVLSTVGHVHEAIVILVLVVDRAHV